MGHLPPGLRRASPMRATPPITGTGSLVPAAPSAIKGGDVPCQLFRVAAELEAETGRFGEGEGSRGPAPADHGSLEADLLSLAKAQGDRQGTADLGQARRADEESGVREVAGESGACKAFRGEIDDQALAKTRKRSLLQHRRLPVL